MYTCIYKYIELWYIHKKVYMLAIVQRTNKQQLETPQPTKQTANSGNTALSTTCKRAEIDKQATN